MRKFILAGGLSIFILGFGMSACKWKGSTKSETNAITTADNSRVSIDWEGTYTGTVPCADCAGILTKITLKKDNTYNLQIEYMGKEGSAQRFEGTFKWDDSGSVITLGGLEKESMPAAYLVGENKLIQLDMNGKTITGEEASKYELTKTDNN
ncbi:MAG: copper resistance protein NlpE [Chitinophagaceae bacterium]|nr:copper resistance protein NlpE [Chitinophagaceae bacterium]